MRDVDEGDSDFNLDALQLDLHLATEFQVESTKWLIKEKNLWLVDKSPCHGDSLLLAT
ncbi:hypothetical protein GALL_541000 [mine drainage metagenome]|uniref:Uncharacterized protein n=1 Tax=mine drainage metagenome TaxID=410659 RepID=A0A1J5PLD3_9ZZZZ